MTIQAIIADDEVLARQKLRHLLEDEKDVEIVGEGATAQETIELAQLTEPDVILLDIQMPGMDGFDVVSALSAGKPSTSPRIIFTTAFDQYALRAFEINAVDYLLKPFTRERLQQAMQRVREQIALQNEGTKVPKRADEPYTTRIVFKSRGRILFLPISDIRWIGAEENYVRICTDRENHLLRETMANFEGRLDPRSFIRVHRSAIVNLQYVKEIRTDSLEGESFVLMQDGQKVPVSRGYKAKITGLLAH
ncbi:response regulator transcription factor [Alloacidobacterium dinghuense]|uniref:Response regulator transcription factor n=1 Tax=Alloacidobacterium dinghuense TaxID=2763107 RepID=A0A7G8BNH4_9BACT|nr:LytTR family DNA-binding domain-containing protein [Alloacidobacterium dinghuense]QNI34094.1 response regulator transcription factor [Alloacidobacterium dinghuense]